MQPPTPIDFVVLTGFLGSGKTTLLAEYLRLQEAADTAVIVNEAGEIGLDGAILRETVGDVPMTMLSNGCVCCQMNSSLAVTIAALLAADRPQASGPLRRIILETSGLAKPGPILRSLAGLAEFPLRIVVLATYDALRGTQTVAFDEAAAQWAAAHRIVVTKLDAVSPGRFAEAGAELAGLNPLAEAVCLADRASAALAAFAPLAAGNAQPQPLAGGEQQHPRIAVRVARPTSIPAYDDMAAWLDNLAGALGDRLLRLKGLVRVAEADRPLLVQSVGTLFSPPRPFGPPDGGAAPFLVIIARDLAAGELESIMPAGVMQIPRTADSTLSSSLAHRKSPGEFL